MHQILNIVNIDYEKVLRETRDLGYKLVIFLLYTNYNDFFNSDLTERFEEINGNSGRNIAFITHYANKGVNEQQQFFLEAYRSLANMDKYNYRRIGTKKDEDTIAYETMRDVAKSFECGMENRLPCFVIFDPRDPKLFVEKSAKYCEDIFVETQNIITHLQSSSYDIRKYAEAYKETYYCLSSTEMLGRNIKAACRGIDVEIFLEAIKENNEMESFDLAIINQLAVEGYIPIRSFFDNFDKIRIGDISESPLSRLIEKCLARYSYEKEVINLKYERGNEGRNSENKIDLDDLWKDSDVMRCPECGMPLEIKIARHGKYAGKQFYGCSGYADCRYIKDIEETGPGNGYSNINNILFPEIEEFIEPSSKDYLRTACAFDHGVIGSKTIRPSMVAICLGKVVEDELNLGVFNAFRGAFHVSLPEYFDKYQDSLEITSTTFRYDNISSSKNLSINFNKRENENTCKLLYPRVSDIRKIAFDDRYNAGNEEKRPLVAKARELIERKKNGLSADEWDDIISKLDIIAEARNSAIHHAEPLKEEDVQEAREAFQYLVDVRFFEVNNELKKIENGRDIDL